MIYLVSARWYRSASLYFLKELFEVNIYTDNYLTESCETCKEDKEDECKHKNTKTNSNNTSVWNEKVIEIIEIICASLKRAWLIFVQLVSKNIQMYTKLELFSGLVWSWDSETESNSKSLDLHASCKPEVPVTERSQKVTQMMTAVQTPGWLEANKSSLLSTERSCLTPTLLKGPK